MFLISSDNTACRCVPAPAFHWRFQPPVSLPLDPLLLGLSHAKVFKAYAFEGYHRIGIYNGDLQRVFSIIMVGSGPIFRKCCPHPSAIKNQCRIPMLVIFFSSAGFFYGGRLVTTLTEYWIPCFCSYVSYFKRQYCMPMCAGPCFPLSAFNRRCPKGAAVTPRVYNEIPPI